MTEPMILTVASGILATLLGAGFGCLVLELTVRALRYKLNQGCDFALVETLPSAAYHQARMPGAINLPPGQIFRTGSHFVAGQDN